MAGGPSNYTQVEVVGGTGSVTDESALAQLEALNTAIGTAADEAGDPTVIGLLKQIAANTTPTP